MKKLSKPKPPLIAVLMVLVILTCVSGYFIIKKIVKDKTAGIDQEIQMAELKFEEYLPEGYSIISRDLIHYEDTDNDGANEIILLAEKSDKEIESLIILKRRNFGYEIEEKFEQKKSFYFEDLFIEDINNNKIPEIVFTIASKDIKDAPRAINIVEFNNDNYTKVFEESIRLIFKGRPEIKNWKDKFIQDIDNNNKKEIAIPTKDSYYQTYCGGHALDCVNLFKFDVYKWNGEKYIKANEDFLEIYDDEIRIAEHLLKESGIGENDKKNISAYLKNIEQIKNEALKNRNNIKFVKEIDCDPIIKELSDLPMSDIINMAEQRNLNFSDDSDEFHRFYLKQINNINCYDLNEDNKTEAIVTAKISRKRKDGQINVKTKIGEDARINELLIFIQWNSEQNKWNTLWIDEALDNFITKPGNKKSTISVEKKVFGSGIIKYDVILDNSFKIDIYSEDNDEDNYDIYTENYISKISWQNGAVGSRIFKKEGWKEILINSTFDKLKIISVVKHPISNYDIIYLTHIKPDTDAGDGKLVKFDYKKNQFSYMKFGEKFAGWENINYKLSPDNKKILNVYDKYIFGESKYYNFIKIFDLVNENEITVENFSVTDNNMTLHNGNEIFGGFAAYYKWVDNNTIEYNVYEFKNKTYSYPPEELDLNLREIKTFRLK